jgi:hypothetical protein
VHRTLAVPVQANGASLLLASEQCPMAYVNQGASAAQRNMQIAAPCTAFSSADQPAYQYVPCVVATSDKRGIAAGEEILTDYGWKPKDLQRLTATYTRYLAEQSRLLLGSHCQPVDVHSHRYVPPHTRILAHAGTGR